ncbi:MAG TPA: hypothetical protein PKI61_04050 [bacterium]|nr:hypothetical protein [bacterium]HPT29617.1 hypothetical protein [bacterium]
MNEEQNQSGPQLSYRITAPWQLFKDSFNWYKANFKAMFKMILAMVVPIIIFTVVITLLMGGSFLAGKTWLMIVGGVVSAILLLLTIYFAFRGQVGMYLVVKDPKADFKTNYKATRKIFWSGLGLSLLTGLLVLAWSLLLIVPGIIFWVFYSMSFFVFIFEGVRGYQAIKASKGLVKGYWWPVFGRYIYFGLFMIIVSIIVSIPRAVMADGGTAEMAYNFIIQIASYLLTPWFLVYTYFIYRDLKQIKSKTK